jgi:hypothetical protein
MDDARCRQFFLEPTETYHRQYEALRAFFVEKRRLKDIAQQFGYQEGCVAKNKLGHKTTERYFSSGSDLEEIGHESDLSLNVAFPDSFNLSLSDHVHDLITADGPPRCLKTEEAETRVDSSFGEPVILLHYVIEIFALS